MLVHIDNINVYSLNVQAINQSSRSREENVLSWTRMQADEQDLSEVAIHSSIQYSASDSFSRFWPYINLYVYVYVYNTAYCRKCRR